MANRRMFAKSIIDTDLFLNMPISTQVLYFHLAIRADDDGFVGSPQRIQRMLGCGDDDMRLLLARGYIIAFESGVVVITHWNIHNRIQKDRYTPTVYANEKNLLTREKNGAYLLSGADTKCIQDVSGDGHKMDTKCIQGVSENGYKLETQDRLGKDRLGKDRLGKDRLGKDRLGKDTASATATATRHQYGQYKNVLLSDDEMSKLQSEFPDWEQRIERLSEYIASKGAKYKSHLATIRAWARKDKQENQTKVQTNPALNYAQREYKEDDFSDFFEKL